MMFHAAVMFLFPYYLIPPFNLFSDLLTRFSENAEAKLSGRNSIPASYVAQLYLNAPAINTLTCIIEYLLMLAPMLQFA